MQTSVLEDDNTLLAIATREGTPLYVYDTDVVHDRAVRLAKVTSAADDELLFAVMANDQPQILRELAELGVGACVNSMRHLEFATNVGIPDWRIQFTSSGTPRGEL